MGRKRMFFKKIGEKILDLLYPKRCPVCDRIVPYGTKICVQCYPKLLRIGGTFCLKCGKMLSDAKTEYCDDCLNGAHAFHSGRALYQYQGVVKKSIYRFKYAGRKEYGEFFGEQMARHLAEFIRQTGAEAIVPVPLYAAKKRKRGFNQAEVLAENLSRCTGIPVCNLVTRVRNTVPQKQLDREERQNNLKKAFKIRQNDVKLKTTIIIDDIYTTGSTIDAVARVLLQAGVKRVYFVTLAAGRQ